MLSQTNKIIRVEKITKSYEQVTALENVSFDMEEKGFIFINGVSGSGKTTLMNLLTGLDVPSSGKIYYKEKDITSCIGNELDDYRNSEVGIVFQDFNLIDDLTVGENLSLPLMIKGVKKEKNLKLVKEALNFVGLNGYDRRKSHELSAGQKQRVAIARALIKRPKVIFADEATGNLDPKNTEQILKLFDNISKKCLVILISHNDNSAKKYADRIITLDKGKICEDIDNRQIKELYHKPYKISVEGHDYRNKTELENFDIKSEIKNINDKLGHRLETYSLETKIILEKEKECEEEPWIQLEKTDIKHMPFEEILKCVVKIINKQKLKNIFIIFLVAFVSFLFFLVSSLNSNDYCMSMTKYVNNSRSSLFPVKMTIISENGEECDVHKGEEFYTKLREIVNLDEIIENVGSISMYKQNAIFTANAFKYNNFFEKINIDGAWPKKSDEISVSKRFAEKENIGVGEYISDDEKDYKVVGIYDFSNIMDEYSVVLSKDYDSEIFTESMSINLQACNILKSVNFDEYVSEIATVGAVSNIKADELIWGRLPEKENEIVISSYMLQENDMTLEEGFVTTYRLPDLQDEKYCNQYDNFVNMYKYLGKKVEVVGVYYSKEDKEYGDILVDSHLYGEIVNFYKEYLNFESLYVFFDGDNYCEIKAMLENDIFVCDNICTYIYGIKDFFYDMKNIMNIVLIIIIMMVVFLIVSFLSYNIKDYSKTVGIYKSLGIKNIDIVKIFMIYNMNLSVVSILIANMLLQGAVYFINKQILLALDVSKMDVFVIAGCDCLIMSSIVVLIVVMATIVPIIKMVKKQSVMLINKAE